MDLGLVITMSCRNLESQGQKHNTITKPIMSTIVR